MGSCHFPGFCLCNVLLHVFQINCHNGDIYFVTKSSGDFFNGIPEGFSHLIKTEHHEHHCVSTEFITQFQLVFISMYAISVPNSVNYNVVLYILNLVLQNISFGI